MKKLNYFVAIILIFSMISLVSAGLGNFPQNSCVNIRILSNFTGVNLSTITIGTNTTVVNSPMQNIAGQTFNYTDCNTSSFGEYVFDWYPCDSNLNCVNSFNIGTELTVGRAISYGGFTLVLLATFLLTLWGAIKTPWEHKRNDEDKVININNLRYVKVFLFTMLYMLMMFLFGLSYKFFNEASIDGFTQFFYYGYQILQGLLIPIIVVMVVVFLIIFLTNLKLQTKLKLGL